MFQVMVMTLSIKMTRITCNLMKSYGITDEKLWIFYASPAANFELLSISSTSF
jgi:hypothetical protein